MAEVGLSAQPFNSIVGFLIGVPVALVLLTTLANEREDKQLERLSYAAWDDFAERVKIFCSDSRIEALESNTRWTDLEAICRHVKPRKHTRSRTDMP